jgi:hypothetical protein
MKEEEG